MILSYYVVSISFKCDYCYLLAFANDLDNLVLPIPYSFMQHGALFSIITPSKSNPNNLLWNNYCVFYHNNNHFEYFYTVLALFTIFSYLGQRESSISRCRQRWTTKYSLDWNFYIIMHACSRYSFFKTHFSTLSVISMNTWQAWGIMVANTFRFRIKWRIVVPKKTGLYP